MERRWTSVSVLLLLAALLGSRVAAAQDCPSINSSQCKAFASKLAAGACIKPGNVFVFEDKWKSALRTKIAFNSQKRVRFFYVVDGRNIATKYDSLFVGIDRIREQSTTSKIKLTQNWSFRFKTNEEKLKYSRAVKPGGLPTQPIRKWSYLPGVGNVFLLKANDVISKFDIPQAIDESNHAPHARLYRYATGNISCIPFSVGLNSDVDAILGRVIDSSKDEVKGVFFRVAIE